MGPLNQYTFCRLCLCTSSSLMDVFDGINVEGLIVKETIEDLLQLKVVRVHGCPWLTCDNCRDKLNDFRRFKINCIESKVAFENRFPQQIVVMPGGISISTGSTGKPQAFLLLPVPSENTFAKSTSNLQMAPIISTTQDSAPNRNQFLSGVGGGFLIPCSRNEPIGTYPQPNDSQVNGIINSGTNFQMVSLANLSTPQGSQLILPGSNFLAPLSSHAKMETLPPAAVSQVVDSASSASDCIVSSPFNSGSECISSSNVTPSPESVQMQSDGMSVADNDGTLVPKEEVMEQKPEVLDLGCGEGRSTLDDHPTCSPFLEAEIEEKEEKKENCMKPAEVFGDTRNERNHQVTVSELGEGLANEEVCTQRDYQGGCLGKARLSTIGNEVAPVSEKGEIKVIGETRQDHVELSSQWEYTSEEIQCQSLYESYECNMCFEVYHRPDFLACHKLTHKGDPRPYKCRVCKSTFKYHKCQVKHIQNHYNVSNRYECRRCHAGYQHLDQFKVHLKSHIRSHKEKTYACRVCQEVFALSRLRQRHQLRHFKPQNSCPHCEKRFYAKSELNDHVKIHDTKRKYKCNVCGKAFVKLAYLNNHQLVHDLVKRYTCNKCGLKFSQYAAMWQHRKRHEDRNKFVCDKCGKGFPLKCFLKKHVAGHLSGKRRGGRRPKSKAIGLPQAGSESGAKCMSEENISGEQDKSIGLSVGERGYIMGVHVEQEKCSAGEEEGNGIRSSDVAECIDEATDVSGFSEAVAAREETVQQHSDAQSENDGQLIVSRLVTDGITHDDVLDGTAESNACKDVNDQLLFKEKSCSISVR